MIVYIMLTNRYILPAYQLFHSKLKYLRIIYLSIYFVLYRNPMMI